MPVLPKGSVDLTGKSVVLVDDIITTGATAALAVKVLREIGAKPCLRPSLRHLHR